MKKLRLALLIVALAFLAGCAAPPKYRVLWPPPPGESLFEFIGVYTSQNDFERGGFRKFLDAFLGAPPPELFRRPAGVAADGQGSVYVSDNLLKNVRVYDFNAGKVHMLSKDPIFNFPIALEFDRSGLLYVADGGARHVTVVDSEGVVQRHIGNADVLENPAYLALNERLGRLYVSDGKKHRVVVFDLKSGAHLFSFGQPGTAPGEFFAPQGIAIAGDNRVFVADMFNARVEVFSPDGEFLYAFGTRGDGAGQMEMPVDLAFDSLGRLYLVDSRKAALTVMTDRGEPLALLGGGAARTGVMAFGLPNAIFIDANDRIYVTDPINKRFVIWQILTPAYLAAHPITPEDLARLKDVMSARGRKAIEVK